MSKSFRSIRGAWLLAGAVACLAAAPATAAKPTILRGSPTPTVTTYGTGLNNPRGLKFGPDGDLYVAEGGTGGDNSTVGQCDQAAGAPTGPGPYTGAPTGGRISKITSDGTRVTVNDQFPSSQTAPDFGSLVSGVADIAFIGHTLYALTAGAGCSHGVANTNNGIYIVNGSSAPVLLADLSDFQKAHPTVNENAGDFEPDGTWYSMVAVRGALYAVEPNHGELDRITAGGTISRVADISASQGHIVPTAIADHGIFYVGNLNTFPIEEGSAKILSITPSGAVHTVATDLTTVLGVAFDSRGRMYVLENTVGAPGPSNNLGDIVRISAGQRQVLVSGLDLPTAMTFGPDGALYVSVHGFLSAPGAGEVDRIRIDD
jgi:hypothetical protein